MYLYYLFYGVLRLFKVSGISSGLRINYWDIEIKSEVKKVGRDLEGLEEERRREKVEFNFWLILILRIWKCLLNVE